MSELAAREAFWAISRNVSSLVALETRLAISLCAVPAQMAHTATSIALLLTGFLASVGAVVRDMANNATYKALGTRLFIRLLISTRALAADVAWLVAYIAQAVILRAITSHVATFGAVVAGGVIALPTPRIGWSSEKLGVITIGTLPADMPGLVAHIANSV